MILQFSEFQQMVREGNESTILALQCAVSVLRRARELAPELQKPVVAFVRNLIHSEQGEDNYSNLMEHPF